MKHDFIQRVILLLVSGLALRVSMEKISGFLLCRLLYFVSELHCFIVFRKVIGCKLSRCL